MNDHSSENQPEPLALTRKKALQQKRKDILSLTPEAMLDRILSEDNPLPLVHSFPEEDLYFILHEIGLEDSLPVLALASAKQMDFVLDREIWRKDRMDVHALARWMNHMMEADAHRFTRWLMDEKTDLLEIFLHQAVEVRQREHDEDPSDFGDDFMTLDSVLYYRIHGVLKTAFEQDSVPGEDSEQVMPHQDFHEGVVRLVSEMATENHEKYQKILVESAGILSAEAEEDAYRWRNVRLSEKGFPPPEEAMEIYAPLSFDQLNRFRKSTRKARKTQDPVILFAESPFQQIPGDTLLFQVVGRILHEEDLNALQEEFASLCNRIAAADQTVVKTRKDLAAIVQKACGYLQIGLEKIAAMQPRPMKTADLILEFPITAIFRVGFGFAMALKWKVQQWMPRSWFKTRGLSLRFWDETWMGVLGGLLIKKPLFFDPNRTRGGLYREFQSLDEILATEKQVDEILALDRILSLWDLGLGKKPAPNLLSHKNLLLTPWARARLGLTEEVSPVPVDRFRVFYKRLWNEKASPRKIAGSAKKDFLNFLAEKTGLRPEEITGRIGPVLENLFVELEEELGGVSAKSLDPRFVRHFLLEKTRL